MPIPMYNQCQKQRMRQLIEHASELAIGLEKKKHNKPSTRYRLKYHICILLLFGHTILK